MHGSSNVGTVIAMYHMQTNASWQGCTKLNKSSNVPSPYRMYSARYCGEKLVHLQKKSK